MLLGCCSGTPMLWTRKKDRGWELGQLCWVGQSSRDRFYADLHQRHPIRIPYHLPNRTELGSVSTWPRAGAAICVRPMENVPSKARGFFRCVFPLFLPFLYFAAPANQRASQPEELKGGLGFVPCSGRISSVRSLESGWWNNNGTVAGG